MYYNQTDTEKNDDLLAEIIQNVIEGELSRAKDSLATFSCFLDGQSVDPQKAIDVIRTMRLDKISIEKAKANLVITGAIS